MPTSALLSYGFRPFFLVASLWGGVAVPLWLLSYSGWLPVSPAYGDMNWHVHELIFGYAAAVVCGFLFTAIPNWTGRFPVRGWPLLALVLLWALGRVAMLSAEAIGLATVAAMDVLFLATVIAVAAREIIAGSNWRNLRVLVLVTALLAGNILFHVSVLRAAPTDLALRLSIAALLALITLVGGRIIPSFTRNWLVKRAKPLPAPFSRLDGMAIASAVVGLASWVIAPDAMITAVFAVVAGMLLTMRLLRWRGWSTWREPLLVILHLGYAFVPAGFFLLGAGALWPGTVPAGAMVHCWTAGAVGVMTLAVMTRATLGHTGRALTASATTTGLYVAMLTAAIVRIAAPFAPDFYLPLLMLGGLAWSIALLGFAAVYGPVLMAGKTSRATVPA